MVCCRVVMLTGVLVGTLSSGAFAQPQASVPRDYKRIHQKALMTVLDGRPAESVARMEKVLGQFPDDAESHYVLAVARAQLGQIDAAIDHMRQAVGLGMSPGRFVGGTRTLLDPIREHAEFQTLLRDAADRPVHGPMLGCLTDRSVKVWVRTARAAEVRVVVGTSPELTDAVRSAAVRSSAETDFTVEAPVTGLQPATQYYYAVEIDGKRPPGNGDVHAFRTALPVGVAGKLRIAFGGGAGYVPPNERVWSTIGAQKPDLLLLLGDNVYIDRPTSPEMQHYCYYRRQSRPEFRKLVATTPTYAIWDDHDFGTNDCLGGATIDQPPWKRDVWRVFRNNWVNPAYGGGEQHPGCYFDFQFGQVRFIMLDGRCWRTRPRGGDGDTTMLGPVQRQWLLDRLRGSTATFHVLCSPVPWTYQAKGDSPDTWNGFRAERDAIFDFLTREKIDGVVLLSADRHRSDLWRIERDGGYPLFEMNSSRLTNQHVHGTMAAAEFSYNKTQSFGLVDFDTAAEEPRVTYRIVTIDGAAVFKARFLRSRLRHGD